MGVGEEVKAADNASRGEEVHGQRFAEFEVDDGLGEEAFLDIEKLGHALIFMQNDVVFFVGDFAPVGEDDGFELGGKLGDDPWDSWFWGSCHFEKTSFVSVHSCWM